MNWFQRLFTLPKSKNSIEDLLGKHMSDQLKAIGRNLLAEQLASIFTSGLIPALKLEQGVKAAASQLFNLRANPELEAHVNRVIAEAFDVNAYAPLAELQKRIQTAVEKELKLNA